MRFTATRAVTLSSAGTFDVSNTAGATFSGLVINAPGSYILKATDAAIAQIVGTFDVILANIGWAALVDLAPELRRLLSSEGWLAVSGISPAHGSRITASLRPLQVIEVRTCGEWTAMILAHRT